MLLKFLVVSAFILIIWHIWGIYGSRAEQLKYSVIEKRQGYEIRQYPPHMVAETTVQGNYDEALNEGFRIVAAYIFGGNVSNQSIAMTAPVTEKQSEKIAMTAPVTEKTEGSSHTIAFSMPAKYTLASLPRPTDSRVRIVEVPEKKMAALRYSWYVTPARIEKLKSRLLDSLTKDKVEIKGKPYYAGYNAPWTPPWLERNEILVEIQ
jgi:hypothetical protein